MATVEMAVGQRQAALRLANVIRLEVSAVKASLRSGALTLTDVMLDPPAVLADALLIDVIRWTRTKQRRPRSIEEIGRRAVKDGVNLMLPVARASTRTRAWVAEHGGLGSHRR